MGKSPPGRIIATPHCSMALHGLVPSPGDGHCPAKSRPDVEL